jgi:hypothetical protein
MSESGATPDSSDAMDSADPVVDYSYEKRRLLKLLLGYSALYGVITVFLGQEHTMLDFFVGCPLLILAVIWCHTDAYERDHRIGKMMKFGLIFYFVLAFPIYIFQTRGLRGIETLFHAALRRSHGCLLVCYCFCDNRLYFS